MKITSQNYFETIEKIGVTNLSPALQKGHELIVKATKNGTDWKAYTTFQKQFDLQFEVLSRYLDVKQNENKSIKSEKTSPVKTAKPVVNYSQKKEASVHSQSSSHTSTKQNVKQKFNGKDVELISPETIFIRRFALLHNKTKTKDQVLSFIRSLQKAITERRLRKASKHSAIIEFMQKHLVDKYNKAVKDTITFNFSDKDLIHYQKIAGGEVVMYSVRFIKSYISLQGKDITKEKAKNLHNRIVHAIETNKLSESDKYFKHIKFILNSLEQFVKQKGNKPALSITEAQLNGLEGVLKECDCKHSLSGFDDEREDFKTDVIKDNMPRNKILNSQDVINLKTDKLNFTGKWLNFIGNPSRGFTAMIFGKPKFGKSYLAIDFAGYLARTHGKVLYVAYEEGFDDTMKQKLEDKNVAHPNLFVSDYLPTNLMEYEYVFIDSVNKAGLSPEDLDKLERKFFGVSFVYIFQTTKDGNFKGAMEYKHNVDVVIEVPQRGIATQFGRYNQGGEMKVFG